MSQAKVDRYKKEKADRKKTMRKEKIMRNVKRMCSGSNCTCNCWLVRIFSI